MRKLVWMMVTAVVFLSACESKNKYYTDAVFTDGIEGPYMNEEGVLFVVNLHKNGNIGKISPDGELEVVATLPNGGIGNSIQKWDDSTLIIADYVNHIVWKMDVVDYALSTYIENEAMNQPNDMAVHPNKKYLYLSDPNWEDATGNLWLVVAEEGYVQVLDSVGNPSNKAEDQILMLEELLEENMGTTNGVVVSQDGKYLYVNESIQRNVWRYNIDEYGSVSDKTLIHQFEDAGLDGMKALKNGNVLIARYNAGEVVEMNSEGEIVHRFPTNSAKPTNLTLNKDESKMYVTMQDSKRVEEILLRSTSPR